MRVIVDDILNFDIEIVNVRINFIKKIGQLSYKGTDQADNLKS